MLFLCRFAIFERLLLKMNECPKIERLLFGFRGNTPQYVLRFDSCIFRSFDRYPRPPIRVPVRCMETVPPAFLEQDAPLLYNNDQI